MPITAREVTLPLGRGHEIQGTLAVPDPVDGIVLFAHGSGSSRFSPRNRFVADRLNRDGMGTLLVDLLTAGEEAIDRFTAHLRFDIGLLARRLEGAVRWLKAREDTRDWPLGLFGASTGAAAALVAAAAEPDLVRAVVSRGGRPDLAGDALAAVTAPTLLIVGGEDHPVIDMNREALARLRTTKRLEIVPGAGHLFEEPGTLEQVADLASGWFSEHFAAARPFAPLGAPGP